MSVTVAGVASITKELYGDALAAQSWKQGFAGIIPEILSRNAESARLDRVIGPLHRPGQRELHAIERRERNRLMNRHNIARLGRPAGEFRRAS